MGQVNWIQLVQPHQVLLDALVGALHALPLRLQARHLFSGGHLRARGVALQVEFERQILKTGFSLDRF
jgi:hypothetical protein